MDRSSTPGRARTSQVKWQVRGMTLSAVPPPIMPTWTLVQGGSKRPDGSPAAIISARMRASSRYQFGGAQNGVGALVDCRGMGLAAGHLGDVVGNRLVGVDHLHSGRLADDHRARQGQRISERGDHVAHPLAADLLVIGQRECGSGWQRRGREFRHHRKRHGEKALHVAGAAPVEPAVAFAHAKWVAGPVGGSAGTQSVWPDSATPPTPPGRWWRTGSPCRRRRWDEVRLYTVGGEIVAHEIDERRFDRLLVVSKPTRRSSMARGV
jgi:hypothetical protein